jgi:hypothetical protein
MYDGIDLKIVSNPWASSSIFKSSSVRKPYMYPTSKQIGFTWIYSYSSFVFVFGMDSFTASSDLIRFKIASSFSFLTFSFLSSWLYEIIPGTCFPTIFSLMSSVKIRLFSKSTPPTSFSSAEIFYKK